MPGNGYVLTSSFTPNALLINTVTPSADLVVTGTPVANATAGGDITYDLTVTNNGPDGQINMNLSDLLPTGTTLVSWQLLSSTATDSWMVNAPAPVGRVRFRLPSATWTPAT